MKNIVFGLRAVTALILIQTLWFKFTAHPDSVYIFTKVGLEPSGRIGIGIMELLAGIMLLISRTVWLGAGMTVGIIGGAIFMHLTKLGIEVNGDNGSLFYLAVVTFVFGAIILFVHRKEIPINRCKISVKRNQMILSRQPRQHIMMHHV